MNLRIGKARSVQALQQIARQLRMRNMLAPTFHDAPHACIVAAGPDARFPIGIHQQHLCTRSHDPPKFAQRTIHVSDIFIHLCGECNFKGRLFEWQLQHIGLMEHHMLGIGATTRGELQHGRCNVNRVHMTLVADRLCQRQTGQARTTADV